MENLCEEMMIKVTIFTCEEEFATLILLAVRLKSWKNLEYLTLFKRDP